MLIALVVVDLCLESCPGVGLFSTETLKDGQILTLVVKTMGRVRAGSTVSLVVGLWLWQGSGVFFLDVCEIRPPLFPVRFHYPNVKDSRMMFFFKHDWWVYSPSLSYVDVLPEKPFILGCEEHHLWWSRAQFSHQAPGEGPLHVQNCKSPLMT